MKMSYGAFTHTCCGSAQWRRSPTCRIDCVVMIEKPTKVKYPRRRAFVVLTTTPFKAKKMDAEAACNVCVNAPYMPLLCICNVCLTCFLN